MHKFELLISTAIFAYSIVLILSLSLEGVLVLEYITYLIPYLIIFNYLFILIFIFIKNFLNISALIYSYSVIFLVIITLILSSKYINFTFLNHELNSIYASESINSKFVNLSFLNKLYTNTNYSELNEKLLNEKSDIVGFSEMKLTEQKQIESLNLYPYSLFKESRDKANIFLFSKYPLIKNTDVNIPYILSAISFVDDMKLYIFIVHPEPPINSKWLEERNSNLFKLSEYVKTLPNEKVVIMGDYNLSPWSKTYSTFSSQLPFIYNLAKGNGIYSTWQNNIFQTQIDHIFVSNNIRKLNFISENILGSDHKLISAEVIIH